MNTQHPIENPCVEILRSALEREKIKAEHYRRDFRFLLWVILGMAIVIARLLFVIDLSEKCNVDGPADQTNPKDIKGDADYGYVTSPTFEFVVCPSKGIEMNRFPVLVICQFTNANNGDSQRCPLNNIRVNAADGHKDRKHHQPAQNPKDCDMKLYELRSASLGISRLRDTHFFTNQGEAMKKFRELKKEQATVDLYQVEVDTNLKAADWCKLLESDAPGMTCTVTPVDLITDRKLVATWAPEQQVA